jgi:hypothetical protein
MMDTVLLGRFYALAPSHRAQRRRVRTEGVLEEQYLASAAIGDQYVRLREDKGEFGA